MELFAGFTEGRKVKLEYDDTTVIQLLPVSTGVQPREIAVKNHYAVEFWSGIQRFAKCFPYRTIPKEQALEQAWAYIRDNKPNTETTVVNAKVSDLTPRVLKHFRFCQSKVDYPEQEVPLDPYYYGIWAGDGHSHASAITNIDTEIIEWLYRYAEENDLRVRINGISYYLTGTRKGPNTVQSVNRLTEKEKVLEFIAEHTDGMQICQIATKHKVSTHTVSKFLSVFKSEGYIGVDNMFVKDFNIVDILHGLSVYKNKHIPDVYLRNSEQVRLKVLAGLIDSDGYLNNGSYEISQKNERLANDIVILTRSLEFFTTIAESWKACTNGTDPTKKEKYMRIYFSMNRVSPIIPVLLKRKRFDMTCRFSNNPKLWFDANVSRRVKWSDSLDALLLEKAKLYEGKTNIEWKIIIETTAAFKGCAPDALRSRFRDIKKKRAMS
jgi:LAGLIDADG-like domain